MKGIGVDIAPISRIAAMLSRYNRETLSLLFTSDEMDLCQLTSHPDRYYAACFSTKEAVGKALGVGMVGINWNEVEAQVTDTRLTVNLLGEARLQASKRGIEKWLATWCHWDDYVLVYVLAQ
ncbi:MAG: 4'-phosphopantetheinyl transferase superfamily protein [Chroococcidiopsidaceae cyanobacterium CP_BM_RX_35]|nr:4'-phosphopantetheinyl transferase superfamily protein [Chroococcidiopsidaceae cyanobacterium CP_BM_RX_35]